MNLKKILIILMIGIIVMTIASSMISNRSKLTCVTHHDTYAVIDYRLLTVDYRLLVADNPSKWEYGLMNIKSKQDICNADGMIFKFPIAIPQTFWNKNTLVDLDVYWMNAEKVEGMSQLSAITQDGQQTISSPSSVNTVIEIIR